MQKTYEVKYAVRDFYLKYAMKVIVSRALPDVRDGLKPVHRRILYSMWKQGLLNGSKVKANSALGEVMKIHPHGDASITDAMNRMTDENETLLHAFIEGQGGFGKVYSDDSASAPRYLDVKLTDFTREMMKDFNKNTVDMILDYNESGQEPLTLPNSFPNILVMGSSGIAVAYASEIPPFNLTEVCDATMAYIKNKRINIADYLLAPDFPTGGSLVYDKEAMQQIYKTGRGSIILRAKYTYDKENNLIEIHEIPYTTTVNKIVKKVTELIKENKIQGISDIRDETGFDENDGETALNITIDLKRGVDPEKLMEQLFKKTPLQSSFAFNVNVLVNYKPQVLGVKEILDEWIAYRITCIKRSLTFDIEKKTNELHYLNGLKKVLVDIDMAIKIIRETKDENLIVQTLMEQFSIDEQQANQVAEMKFRTLNEKIISKRINEIESLEQEIADLKGVLEDEAKMGRIIVEQLEHVKKTYGKPRKTTLIEASEIAVMGKEDLIEDYNTRIFITEQGYVKKIRLTSLKSSQRQHTKDMDRIKSDFHSTNKSDILVFTDQQNLYKIKAYDLPDSKASLLGEYLPSLLKLKDERILYVTSTEEYKEHLIIGFDNGKVARIDFAAYKTKQNLKKMKSVFNANQVPIYWQTITEDVDIIAQSTIDKVLVFNTSRISPKTSKATIGTQAMKSKDGSSVRKYYAVEDVSLEDLDYYRTAAAGIGKYLKKTDSLSINNQ